MRVLRGKTLRLLLALLAGLAVASGGYVTPSASAAEPEALVSISLATLKPSVLSRDGTVTVTGSVTNVTKQRLDRLRAYFWRNQAPITTAEGMEQALASNSNEPLGARQTSYAQDLYTPDDPYLEPGDSATFTLKVPIPDLQLSPTDGVYLMGVHVLQAGSGPFAVGRARVFVPVVENEPSGRLQMTSVVVLSSRPSLLRRGVLVDEHLADEVRSGGRLDELLSAADSAGTSFAVDPELVEELTTMKDGYTVQTGDGPATTGRGRTDAARWLSRFAALESSRDGFRLLYGSPDLAALVHARQTALLAAAVEAGRRVTATTSLPLLVLPAGGLADEDTVRAAEQLHPAAIMLSDASAPGDSPLLAGPDVRADEAPIVRFSTASSGGGGPGPDPRTTPVQLRQRALADSWVEATTAGTSTTRGRVRLITSTDQLQGDDPGVSAPWVSRSTLDALLSGSPARWNQQYVYPESAVAAELTPSQLGSLQTFARRTSTYAELLVDGDDAKANGQAAVARMASAAWRDHDRLRRRLLAPQQAALDSVLLDGLQISSNPKVSTVAREGVEFPITVKNLLPVDREDEDINAVNLKLVFVSDLPQRLTIKALPICPEDADADETSSCLPTILPGTNITRNAKVTARANGTVPVKAQLQTADGTPVGRPVMIDVRVTQNGTTGWAIAGAAMVVFLGGTALRIRRVGKARAAAADPDPGEAQPSALTSAPPTDADALERTSPDGRDRLDA